MEHCLEAYCYLARSDFLQVLPRIAAADFPFSGQIFSFPLQSRIGNELVDTQ